MFVDVGARSEFEEGVPRVVEVDGREIGVLAWRGELFGMLNTCPHQLGPVCKGHAMPLLIGNDHGEMVVDERTPVIVCPWHGWEFDARTGHSAWPDSRYTIKTFRVKEESGRVLVDAGRERVRTAAARAAGGER